jgi:hypothetical protein
MRLVCRALPPEPIIFRPGAITKETPFDVGDETVAHFTNGRQIVLHRSTEHYRVSVLDGRNFPDEAATRACAKRFFVDQYPGGAVRTVLQRHGQTVTYVRTPKETPCP